MSRLSQWLKSLKLGSIEKLAKSIIATLKPILAPSLAASVDTLWETSKMAVNEAENVGGSGDEKFEHAFKTIKAGLGEASKVLVSVAIELSVALLRAKYKL